MSQTTPAAEGWRAVAAEMIAGTWDALARFPVTALFLLAAALDANWLIMDRGLFGGGRDDLILPLVGGALASLAVSLFSEARGGALWIRHGGSLAAGIACFLLLWLDRPTRTLDWTLIAALAGLVPVAGFLGRGTSGSFWLFSARLAFAAVLAFLALLLFAGGISAILASLTYLFGIGVPDKLYSHIWVLTGLFAAPLFGLGQIARDFTAEPDTGGNGFMERGIRALGEFVAAPLLIVYAAILHAYALKIVLTRAVPEGQIGWLVLAFGLCTVGSLIVCRPFMRSSRAPTRFFLRIWPLLLPVPLLLLGYALFLRVGAYGLTPDRYLLALFGVVLLIVLALQFFASTRGDIRLMAALPAIALFLASFGPQGAEAVSVRSQQTRFLAIVNAPPVEGSRHDEALSALRYLSANDGLARIRPEGFVEPENGVARFRALALAWGLDPDRPVSARDRYFSLAYRQETAVAIEGFDLVVPSAGLILGQRQPTAVTLPGGRELEMTLEQGALVIGLEGEAVRFPLDAGLIGAAAAGDGTEPPRLLAAAGTCRILLVPTYLYGERGAEPFIRSFTGAILLRSADWR